MRIEIKAVPPSLNKVLRMHWAKRYKLRDSWLLYILTQIAGKPHLRPLVRMEATITLHHSRLYDKDNAYGASKVVVDALKYYRLIMDDTPQYLSLTVKQEKAKRKDGKTVIELVPA